MPETTIRPAIPEDVSALLPLYRAYADFYESKPTDEGLRELMGALIAAPDSEGFLLAGEIDGELAGFAACDWKWSSLRGARMVYLEDLFVAPDARGHGLADELIKA